ncbi:MAG: RNA polymerase sigma factor [Candidatus Promineifilaceae bacterium]
MNNQRTLETAVEEALQSLETGPKQKDVILIRTIIFENLTRGGNPNRLQNYLQAHPGTTPCDYVFRVADYYEDLNGYLYEVQEKKSNLVWEPLFVQLQWWAYNFLRKKDFPNGGKTFQLAKDCAADAGGELVKAYFPYDTSFEAWACTIVQNHCRKAVARLLRARIIPEHKLVSMAESPVQLERTADLGGGRLTEWRLTLMQLIEQLPTEEQQTILLYEYEGLTLQEIGEFLGISTTTVHRRYFSAIDYLRKNLTQERILDQ